MDNPTQTSQRIRPILRAMERSIEDARRRRSGDPAPVVGAATSSGPSAPAPEPARSHSQTSPAQPASVKPLHSASQPALQTIRPESSPSEGQMNGAKPSADASPDQPARLKARPKRWLSASA